MVNGPHDLYMLLKILRKGKHVRGMPSTSLGWEKMYGLDISKCGPGKAKVTELFRKHVHYFFKEQSDDFPQRRLKRSTDVMLHRRQTKALIQLTTKSAAGRQALAMLRRLGGEFGSIGEVKDTANLNAYLNKARQAALVDYGQKCSTKVQAIVEAVQSGPKPAVVFVEFRTAGVEQIKKCLRGSKLRIGQMHGSISKSKRLSMQTQYNAGKIDVLLITKAAAEGVDLKATRQFHNVCPVWNPALAEQAEGRTIRYRSHAHLPKSQRVVDGYNWVAMPELADEEEFDKLKTGGARVEERLRMISLRKKKLIDEYMVALQEAAHDGASSSFNEAAPAVPDELDAAAMIRYLVEKGDLYRESKWNITKLLIEGQDGIRHVKKHGRRRKSAQRASKIIRKKSQEMLRAAAEKADSPKPEAKPRPQASTASKPKAKAKAKAKSAPKPKAKAAPAPLSFDEDAAIADLMKARKAKNARKSAKTSSTSFDEDAPIADLMKARKSRKAKEAKRAKAQMAFAGTPKQTKTPAKANAPKKLTARERADKLWAKVKLPPGLVLLL